MLCIGRNSQIKPLVSDLISVLSDLVPVSVQLAQC
jgi:hypothetical protein